MGLHGFTLKSLFATQTGLLLLKRTDNTNVNVFFLRSTTVEVIPIRCYCQRNPRKVQIRFACKKGFQGESHASHKVERRD